MQDIPEASDRLPDIPGITVPQLNYGPNVGGKDAPEPGATDGATFGVNIDGGGTDNEQVQNTGFVSTFKEDRFGDGSDGDVVISSNTTLTSDMYYNNLTVNVGISLDTGGFRIFVKDTLTNNGHIHRDGNDGGDGDSSAVPTPLGGAAGPALAAGTIYGGLAGKVGGNGATSIGDGQDGQDGSNQTESFASDGVDGGDGGGAVSTGQGGDGGVATETIQPPRTMVFIQLMREFSSDDTVKYIKTSASSGSGGGGHSFSTPGGEAGAGGGSGSSGGIVLIFAKTIVNNGIISADGGDGGDGGAASNVSNPRGGGGGGGAGSGGLVFLIYEYLTVPGTIRAAGGVKGLGGVSFNPSYNGQDGQDGLPGKVIQLIT